MRRPRRGWRATVAESLRSVVQGALWLLGRKNLIRLSEILESAARLDVPNDLARDGELTVQECFLAAQTPAATLSVLDVGANVGAWTRELLERSRGRQLHLVVHAIEPSSPTCTTLRHNLAPWGEAVKVHEKALSSVASRVPFFSRGAGIETNSLYRFDESYREAHLIETETLDDFCARHEVAHVHFMKIDAEGHDLEILYGARGMLERRAVDLIQFEYTWRWIHARRYLRDAFEYLTPLGMDIGKVTPRGIEFYPGWHHELERFREANFLAVRPELRRLFPSIPWWLPLFQPEIAATRRPTRIGAEGHGEGMTHEGR